MSVVTRAVLTAAVAAVVALCAVAGQVAMIAVAGVLVLVVAVGWPGLVSAPAPRGAGVVVGLGGLGGLAAAALTDDDPYLRDVPSVLAVAVLAAFVHELVRRDGRERLVESVAGSISGLMAAATAAGWVAAIRTDAGTAVVVTGAAALAVASAVSAAPTAGWLGAALTVVAGVAVGTGAAAAIPDVDPVPGTLIGLAVGVLAATVRRLLDRLPSLRGRLPAVAAAVVPVAVTGMLVYVVGRVLVG